MVSSRDHGRLRLFSRGALGAIARPSVVTGWDKALCSHTNQDLGNASRRAGEEILCCLRGPSWDQSLDRSVRHGVRSIPSRIAATNRPQKGIYRGISAQVTVKAVTTRRRDKRT